MSSPSPSAARLPSQAWLARTPEAALEPELPIIDAHHHLWDRPGDPYLLREFLADAKDHNILATVFAECHSMYRKSGPPELAPVGETEFVLGLAAMSASGQYGPTAVAAGIVGHADLRLGAAVAPVLERHLAIAPSRFKGVRYRTAYDPDRSLDAAAQDAVPGLMSDATFRSGVACLGQYGLAYDVGLYHHQLPALAELARAVPGTTIVVNHIGGPIGQGAYSSKRTEVYELWTRGIALLAECENVVVKLGGLGIPRYGNGWELRDKPPGSEELAEAFVPYFGYCMEKLGARRCMFESNFPVDKVSYSYTVFWNACKRLTHSYSESERAALFRNTATRTYRLGAPPG